MCFLLWALHSQVKTAQLLSQRSAVLCVHAQTPTNLVDSLIMEGKHEIMPKLGGLQELKEGGSHWQRPFFFCCHSPSTTALFIPTSIPPKYTLYKWGVDYFVSEISPVQGPIRG